VTGLRRAIVLIVAVALGAGAAAALAAADHTPAAHRTATHVVCRRVRFAWHSRVVCHRAKTSVPTRAPSSGGPAPQPAPTAGSPLVAPPSQTTSTDPIPVTTTPAAALPSRVAIDEYEYSIVAGHPVVAAGSVQLSVSNIGQDDHDLVIAKDGVIVAQTPILHPGDPATTITVQLGPGTYTLYCSLYNHAQMGMTATLVAA
jgi:hypothetical protein